MTIKSREKILLILVVVALGLFAFDRFYYLPQKKRISNLKEQVKAVDLRLKESIQVTQGVETLEAEVARLEKELQGWRKRMLPGAEFRAFLRHLAKDTDRLRIKMISLAPQEEKIPPPEGKKGTLGFQYQRVMIQMVLYATYSALGTYLKGIEELPFLVTVDNLQIERNEEILPFLKVTLGLSVHTFST
jgi:Tfp pilus assembly protein PilO